MAPRLNKRQLREKDELLNLSGHLSQGPENEQHANLMGGETVVENMEPPTVDERPVGFAALGQLNNDIEGDDGDEDDGSKEEEKVEVEEASRKSSKKKNKKKKKKTIEDTDAPQRNTSSDHIPPQKKGGKKTKGKGKVQDEGDDLDKALAELSEKYPDLKGLSLSTTKDISTGIHSFFEQQTRLLCVSLPHLDSESEMRRFFGSKIVNSSKSQIKQARAGRANTQGLKSNLTKPQPTWWSATQREALSARLLTPEERSKLKYEEKEEKWWTIVYSKRYRSVTKAFMNAVLSGDPNRLYQILSKLPWHADTLLQMTEYFRHREEHASAVDFLNRALFTYERALIGVFSFTIGTNRLDFNQVENRPFYLALNRMVMDLNRRGCTRTSFEFARLLLGLDPYSDPHGSLLFLDYLSIRSGMHEWLLSIWEIHSEIAKTENGISNRRFNVTTLPGWSYARALALRAKESSNKELYTNSTEALEEAIINFPSVVPLLADKVDITLPTGLRGLPAFQVHVDASNLSNQDSLIHLLSHLYVQRSASLWKIPENSSWLKTTVLSLSQRSQIDRSISIRALYSKQYGLEDGDMKSLEHSELARSIYRHVVTLTDATLMRQLNAFFPRGILNAMSLSCDPLPPLSRVSEYNDSFFSGCEDIFAFRPRTGRERDLDARQLARMIPDANVRLQIQALFDARPDIQHQFPGGVFQFAQVVAQLGEDFFDDLIPQMAEGRDGGDFPGGFPGEIGIQDDALPDQVVINEVHEHNEGDDEEHAAEDESDTEVDAPNFPVRIWQNLVARIWGTERNANENPDNDDEN